MYEGPGRRDELYADAVKRSVAVLVVLVACTPARAPEPDVYVLRMHLALRDERARTCEGDCAAQSSRGTNAYLECLAGCPGTEVDDGDSCVELGREQSCWIVKARTKENRSKDDPTALDILSAVGTTAADLLELASKAGKNRPDGG